MPQEIAALVRMSDTAYAVESFELIDDGEPQKQLKIEGWFHARLGVMGMQLAIPDAPAMLEQFRLPSPELISLFGETGRNCRFRLETRIAPEIEPKLAGTRLLALITNNDGITIDVSPLLTSRLVEPEPAAAPPVPATHDAADQALVMRFESLGDNCEFGLMQRAVGHERLGLLRYADARDTARLIEAIRDGFEGFATPDDLWIYVAVDEWIVSSQRTKFVFHTGIRFDLMTEPEIRAAESTKLAFMAEKLVEDIQTGAKVFVRRADEGEPEAGMDALYDALQARGPATLLWVTAATDSHPHGTVAYVRGRLFRAYHGHLAPYSAADRPDAQAWLSLLRAAEAEIARHDAQAGAPEAEVAPAEGESWRVLTGAEATPGAAGEPPAEGDAAQDEAGFLGRLFGRKRQDNS